MIRLENYKRIHSKVMESFIKEGFVISDGITFGEPSGGYITLQGQIHCLGGLQIAVDKRLRILGGTGGHVRVTTAQYSYNVSVSGRGNLIRYDSAHDHRPHHHVHRFDSECHLVSVHEIHDENKVPTLGDVITEVRDLYYSPEFSDYAEGDGGGLD